MIFFVEIHGYGLLSDPFDVTDTARDEPYLRVTLGVELDAEDVGRTIYLQGPTGLTRDTYTIAAVDGFDVLLATDDGGTWSGDGGGALEEMYHLSDGTPAFASGANAAAMWREVLEDAQGKPAVTTTAGQTSPLLGGIASVDGIEVQLASAMRDAFCALLYPAVAKLAIALDGTDETVTTWGGALTDGAPAYIGAECIQSQGSSSSVIDGVTYYEHDVRRGVLGTTPTAHAAGEWLIENVRTPIGLAVTCWRIENDAESIEDAVRVFSGVCEGWSGIDATVLKIASHVLGLRGRTLGQTPAVQWVATTEPAADGGEQYIWSQQPPAFGTTWPCIDVEGFCLPRPVVVDYVYGEAVEIPEHADFTPWKPKPWSELEEIAADLYIDQSANIYFLDQQWARLNRRSAAYSEWAFTRAALCPIRPVNEARAVNDTARTNVVPYGWIEVHPVEAIRQILQSTGFGALGDYDTLPRECGCALPNSALDTDSFDDLIAATPTLTAANVIVNGAEIEKLPELLVMLLRTYGFGLVSDRFGRVRIVDLTDTTPTLTLTVDDLAFGFKPTYSAGYKTTLTAFSVTVERPWLADQIIENMKAGADFPVYAEQLGTSTIAVKPPFAAYVDEVSRGALVARMADLLGINAAIGGTLRANVSTAWTGSVGDVVRVTFDQLPGSVYGDESMDCVGRVIDLDQQIREVGESWNSVTIALYGATDVAENLWAPTVVVATVTADDEFTVVAGGFGADGWTRFRAGDRVMLYDSTWTARADDPTPIDSVVASKIFLSAAWKSGGLDITPAAGDIVALVAYSSNPALTRAEWAWLRAVEEWA